MYCKCYSDVNTSFISTVAESDRTWRYSEVSDVYFLGYRNAQHKQHTRTVTFGKDHVRVCLPAVYRSGPPLRCPTEPGSGVRACSIQRPDTIGSCLHQRSHSVTGGISFTALSILGVQSTKLPTQHKPSCSCSNGLNWGLSRDPKLILNFACG